MPLFVFLSGYFTKTYGLKSIKMWGGLLMLVETYIFFDILHRLPDFFNQDFSLYRLIEPSWSLWYLLSLMYWRFLAQIISLLDVNKFCILFCAVTIGLVGVFLPIGYGLSIQRTFAFFPFFMCGFLCSKTELLVKLKEFNAFFSIFSILCLLFTCLFFVNFNISDVVWGGKPYAESIFGLWIALAYRVVFYIVSSLLCISVINLFLRFFSRENIAAIEGKKTMLYYVYHTFILELFFYLIEKTSLKENPLYAFFITILVIFILFYISRIYLFTWLVNPITNVVRFSRKRGGKI